MRNTSNKEINELIRKAERLGWRVGQTGRNHLRWTPPEDIVSKYGKAFVITSLTPSDVHAVNQMERDLKKAGLYHLEETLEKVDLEQTKEEKYLDLGTSLPIPVAQDKPTLRDVAPPELLNGSAPKPQVEVEVVMPKQKQTRVNRTELRAEILRVISNSSIPMSSQQVYDKLPAKLVADQDVNDIPKHIANINRGGEGIELIGHPRKGWYQYNKEAAPPPRLSTATAPSTDPLANAGEILNRALDAIGDVEKLVNVLRERATALEAVRKLLGGV